MMFKQKNTIDIITIFCIYCKQPLAQTEKHDYHTTCKQALDEYKIYLQTLRTTPIEYLLPQEEQQLPIVRNKWINALYQRLGQPLNTQKTIELLEFVHPAYKDKQPELIICKSPYEAQLRANNQVRTQVRNQVCDQVRAQIWAQIRDQVWPLVDTQICAQVWDQVRTQVNNQIRDQVYDKVWAQVWAQVENQVWYHNKLKYYYFTESLGVNDYYWLAYYDFFTDIGLLNHDGFNCYRALLYAAKIYDSLLFENMAILIEYPVVLSDTEIVFRDGYKVIKN